MIFYSLLFSTLLLFSSCCSYLKTNEKNEEIAKLIVNDIKSNKTLNKHELKLELDKKYNLTENKYIRIYLIFKDTIIEGGDTLFIKDDIEVSVYSRPLGPSHVYSLNRDSWKYEE